MKKKTGPRPRNYKKILVNIPIEYVALMKAKNEKCGGLLPVSQQIRDAIRGSLYSSTASWQTEYL